MKRGRGIAQTEEYYAETRYTASGNQCRLFGVSSRRVHLRTIYCFISSDVLLSSRYDLVNTNRNWIQANAYCKHHYRAKLVMINSQADQLRLQAYLETLDGQPVLCCTHTHTRTHARTHTHTPSRLTGLCPGLPGWAGTRKVKPVWILLKQETHSGSGISWAICKSAPCPRQITTPAPHNSVFYRPDALPAGQPTASKHWRHYSRFLCCNGTLTQSSKTRCNLFFLGWQQYYAAFRKQTVHRFLPRYAMHPRY